MSKKPQRSLPEMGDGITPHEHSQLAMSEVSEFGADEARQLKDELLRIRALSREYVEAERRLRKAREEGSDIGKHEAIEAVYDARSALVRHVYPDEGSNKPKPAELEAENKRLQDGIQEAKHELQLIVGPMDAFQEARVNDALCALYRAEDGGDA